MDLNLFLRGLRSRFLLFVPRASFQNFFSKAGKGAASGRSLPSRKNSFGCTLLSATIRASVLFSALNFREMEKNKTKKSLL